MKYLIFVCTLFFTELSAQINLTGEWEGVTKQGSSYTWYSKMYFVQSGDSISGATYYEDESNPGLNVTFKTRGSFKNNVLHYKELEILKEENNTNLGWCYVDSYFNYFEKGDSAFLECKWGPSLTLEGGPCAAAYRLIKRKKISTKTETNLPANIKVNEKITLQNILFTASKSEILPESYPELNKLVDFMKAKPSMKIQIIGHTDKGTTSNFNQALSEGRANAVMNYLMSKGIQKHRLSAIGKGSTQPISDNETKEGRQKNRRVEIIIISE